VVHDSSGTEFGPKLNALNRVRPSKKKVKFYFLFLIDDVAFEEFDRNPNFVPDYILHDVVARETKEIVVLVGCISYVMKFYIV
jgi:hypothetical protein